MRSYRAAFVTILCLLSIWTCVYSSNVDASRDQATNQRHILGRRPHKLHIPVDWRYHSPVSSQAQQPHIEFTLSLRQQNLDKLKQLHREVSDPGHVNYKRHLTTTQVAELVRPHSETFRQVYTWLADHGIDRELHTDLIGGGDAIIVHIPIDIAARLFDTTFHNYHHISDPSAQHLFPRIVGTYSIPQHLRPHIDLVTGLSELLHDTPLHRHLSLQADVKIDRIRGANKLHDIEQKLQDIARQSMNQPEAMLGDEPQTTLPDDKDLSGDVRSDFFLNPHTMRLHAGVPASSRVTEDVSQGVVAFNGQFSHRALRNYLRIMDIATSDVVKQVGPDIEPVRARNESEIEAILAHSIESDLDIQFLVGVGRGAKTEFWNMAPGRWVLDFAQQATAAKSPPSVFSISYGFPEMESCALASSSCSSLSLDAKQYMERTNVEFQKLGAAGVSVIVAAGDDGAPGHSANCPAVPAKGGECGSLLITQKDGDKVQQCSYPAQARHCRAVRHEDCKKALADYAERAPRHEECLASIADGGLNRAEPDRDSKYVTVTGQCSCDQMLKFTYRSCTIEGFHVVKERGPVFAASFPATSPYVTSVGATQFTRDSFPACKSAKGGDMLCPVTEVAASRTAGNRFTSGGGFSAVHKAESWQTSVIDAYLEHKGEAQLPPKGTFEHGNRGYPDVAMPGSNCLFNNPISLDINDGTSCSTPSFAGLITLLNSRLKGGGDKPLGFLNPWLYQMAQRAPETFSDVRHGDNCCSREFCCQYCFTAGTGWDPVTGFGTPNFIEILTYMDKVGPAASGWSAPTSASTSQSSKSSGGAGSSVSADSRVVYGDILVFAMWYVLIPFIACGVVAGAIVGYFFYKVKNPKGWKKLNTYE